MSNENSTEKHPLQKVIESNFDNLESRFDIRLRSYSGRGMYGKSCLGVVLPHNKLGKLVAHIVAELIEAVDCGDMEPADYTRALRGVESLESDNMGLDSVVYFPSVPFVEEFEDDGEEESDTDED